MKTCLCILLVASIACADRIADPSEGAEVAEWAARAENITIIRDDWGIPHIYGATDADAVFGLMYAQAEDDFNCIETNYLNSMGRLAEAEGEELIWQDLRMRLFIDPVELQAMYSEASGDLRDLMDAWADGLNYYLHKHTEVTPRVLTRFEPWMALSFSEGSIGGDIERVSVSGLRSFYESMELPESAAGEFASNGGFGRDDGGGGRASSSSIAMTPEQVGAIPMPIESGLVFPDEPTGSNGFAIAPSNTVDGNALLLINPHTSFFFRHEAHVVSEEGLNAYGALTWGQFFIYQGFNETAGWMHTSSGVDNIDEFLLDLVDEDGALFYRYGEELRPIEQREVVVRYQTDTGQGERTFTVYRTHYGPIVRTVDGQWVSVALMEEPLSALRQSYDRTKAANYAEFRELLELHTNSSNNTLFADSEGNIAYFHSNFIPRRDDENDYARPVDGSDPANDWQGVLSFDETPNVINPPNGWVFNTNNWPFSAAGENSPRQEDYPSYVQRGGENARGIHAAIVLKDRTDFTLDGLVAAAFDTYLPAFEQTIPALIRAFDEAGDEHPLKAEVADQVALLREWDLRFSVESVPTSLAIFWSGALRGLGVGNAENASVDEHLEALAEASNKLATDFGDWRTPWGEINRFQRLTGDIVQQFDDAAPSTPVAFPSATWGSLVSFGARAYPGTSRWYGTSGNSFVAVVEFGDRVRARAVTAGGLNSVPSSPHFNDQTDRYATGNLRDVYFYRADVDAHAQREYHPGG